MITTLNNVCTTTAVRDVINERRRQVDVEGWSFEHDLNHDAGELSGAGAAYALHAACELHPIGDSFDLDDIPPGWCWDKKWWKPTNPRRDLVKAAALIIAEIDRLDMIEEGATGYGGHD